MGINKEPLKDRFVYKKNYLVVEEKVINEVPSVETVRSLYEYYVVSPVFIIMVYLHIKGFTFCVKRTVTDSCRKDL